MNFAFLVENVPSNISTHFARHVHAQPYISSLRNDRQDKIDGDEAPRTTPVHMIFYCNAEELMNVANKRLCGKASEKTQQVAQLMCSEAARVCRRLRSISSRIAYGTAVCAMNRNPAGGASEDERREPYPLRNPEGYMDLTTHDALTNVMRETEEADLRCNRLIKSVKTVIDLADFDLVARIEVKDRRTGRTYR